MTNRAQQNWPGDDVVEINETKWEAAGCHIGNSEYGEIAETFGKDAMANAALIVRAVNNYERMREALSECIVAYEHTRNAQPTGHLWPDPNHIFHARRALETV